MHPQRADDDVTIHERASEIVAARIVAAVVAAKIAMTVVDAACASSCEASLVVLREHPKARAFGERTAGFIHFGNVGRFTLPHSHVRVNIPTKDDEFPNGKLYDKIGFEPDAALAPNTDAFAAALDWIKGS